MDPQYDLPNRPDQAQINQRGRAYCDEILGQPASVVVAEPATPLERARARAAAERREARHRMLAARRGKAA
jgi:hypothetical protein